MWIWYLIWTVAVVSLVTLYFKKPTKKKTRLARQDILYRQLDSVTNHSEFLFLKALEDSVQGRARVLCKVSADSILRPENDLEQPLRESLFNRVCQKHFDFVLCDAASLQPLCAIKLDEKSRNTKDAKERDRFLLAACESARLPFHTVLAAEEYDAGTVSRIVEPHLQQPSQLLRTG